MTVTMSEAEFQARITDLCDWLGLWWFHSPDSRRSNAGMPDLTILNLQTGAVVFVEVKAQKGRLRVQQTEVLLALERGGHEALIVRPSDWPNISTRLRDLARGVNA